ncbi:uncharacterized protein A1O9_04376 [Exophiala aquamarina CBS 119918]|uniref:Uncharacterized protein n=1 Tax=Exophiala aquamarina CBS 119918 TaxID=1182545 RepID=A0A072PIE8_9EURO|nr:uncharacterized protein A1O9_04376 [Exophiala aquamarina CBS 119918]KEF59532.1 hypothetical protein A1O9_04376 [Exophiala aquamarina CBS 119918]
MPANVSPAVIVARFLKANHYDETLAAFLAEAGLPEDAADTKPGDWTIEQVLEEKKQYDSSLLFEKKGDGLLTGWTQPAPSKPVEPDTRISSNILCVSGAAGLEDTHEAVFITAADKSWSQISTTEPFGLTNSIYNAHASPVLSISSVPGPYIFSTSMSGQLMLHDGRGRLLDKCRDHLKYAVQVVSSVTRNGKWIVATAGWDQKVHIYAPEQELAHRFEPAGSSVDDDEAPHLEGLLGDPVHTITLPSNPESMVIVQHPDTLDSYLIIARRDSTFLYYYCITPTSSESSSSRTSEATYSVQETGKQNLAPHSNAWIAFTPSCLAVSPADPTLLAVATSHLPHMKLIIVRLLFPSSTDEHPQTQASQTRAALAVQDREDNAIKLHVSTMSPQTPYSTPQVVWRPGGSGVFVNADDGVVRGVDTDNGKVVSLLRAHEVGSKVRTLYAGYERNGNGKSEILISGGFDKKVFIWRVT